MSFLRRLFGQAALAHLVPADHVIFDIETIRGPDEVGGWEHPERFAVAVAVTWDEKNYFREWFEDDAKALVEELARQDRVVGFNVLDFDYRVLSAYEPNVSRLQPKTIDILADVHKALGFRISLNDLAQMTLGRHKTSKGEEAIRWWREGKRDLVVKYCRADVALSRDIYVHGVKHGVIYYPRYGSTRPVRVNW